MSSNSNQPIEYDFAFIGMGASNILLLIALSKRGVFKNKKIAVIEPDAKSINDKTYCFWADANDSIVADCRSIIHRKFDTVSIKSNDLQKTELANYYCIQSIDLYNFATEYIQAENVTKYNKPVVQISPHDLYACVAFETETIKAHYVFDSRPIAYQNLSAKYITLKQSFIGYHVRCEKDVFDTSDIEMMNFNIDQNNYTQFIYTIPLSKNEALIELTRFGDKLVEGSYANEVLDAYIKNEFGNYELLHTEIGCIPMSSYVYPPAQLKNVLHTGTRANMIKPSTGYGFKNMYAFAEKVSEQFQKGELTAINQLQTTKQSRFYFYDTLLLIILRDWPAAGKTIFTALFKTSSIKNVLKFLDEKSSIQQEIQLFLKLPIVPFLKALFKHLMTSGLVRYTLSLLTVLIYLFLANNDSSIAHYFMVSAMVVGLLSIGLPHGSLDQLVSQNKNEQPFKFITKYFLMVLIYFILWYLIPVLSLLVFLIYSSFHFGESELVQSNTKLSPVKHYLVSTLLGASILTFIISTHVIESIELVSIISKFKFSEELTMNLQAYSMYFATASFLVLILNGLSQNLYKYRGLLFILLLGILTPLPLAFGLYFIAQHSVNAWNHIQSELKLSNLILYRKAFPFTIAAVFFFIAFIYIANHSKMSHLLAYFFIFLASISLPHFVMMHLFYRNKNE